MKLIVKIQAVNSDNGDNKKRTRENWPNEKIFRIIFITCVSAIKMINLSNFKFCNRI
jgi:hypothetical protein